MEGYNYSNCEPMDIDLSGHSVKEMDISYNDSFDDLFYKKTEKCNVSTKEVDLSNSYRTESLPVVKKYHINIQKPTRNYKGVLFQILSVSFIILISLFISYIYSVSCCEDLNLETLRETLSNKVFGQTKAIEVMIKTLELKERRKILIFSGGTGVGKTFASSILLDIVGSHSNLYHYTMPSFINTFTTDFMIGLTICKNSLIIVDGLSASDMHIKTQIKELIDKSEQLEKDVTVILIFNCYESTKDYIKNCDESFQRELLNQFVEIKALKRFVNFETLTETHLKECIKQELGNRQLNSKEFNDILKIFNVTVDGCKGVHSKIKYLSVV